MRQDDINRLTKRLDRILKEMMPPESDYKSILVIAEKEPDGVKLSLGTNATWGVAAAICEMAMREFTRHAEQADDMAEIADTLDRFFDLLERVRSAHSTKKAEVDDDGKPATKH
jgi:hypothetical protein